MNEQQYIEQQVEIRVQKEIAESKFMSFMERLDGMQRSSDIRFAAVERELLRIDNKIDKTIERLDNKMNIMIGICMTAIIIPITLKAFGIF